VTFEDRGQEPLAQLDIDTLKVTQLDAAGTSGAADVSRDGTFLVFSKMDFSHPAELFRLNLEAAVGSPTPLTRMNAEVLSSLVTTSPGCSSRIERI
jgi:dipeptidyl aminopeptidase/acylaminoacyl peptidase